jgi:hypothetical protein
MAGLSGKNGKVQSGGADLAEVTHWTFNPTSNNPAWHGSGGGGTKQRVAGVKDGSGTVDFKYDDADKIHDAINEGDSVTLNLYVDANSFFAVPALVDGISYDVDIDDGEAVSGTIDFSANGAWTLPTV